MAAAPRESWRQRYPALARFAANRISVAAGFIILMLLLIATFGPMIYTVPPGEILMEKVMIDGEEEELLLSLKPPSAEHWLGTDPQGRDTLARLLAGARISLAVGFVSCIINLVIGVGIGALAGWFHATGRTLGLWIDNLLMRGIDILYSLPLLLVVILMQLFLKPVLDSLVGGRANVPLLLSPDLVSIYVALGVTNWLTMARLTRGEVINQARLDYVVAAEALGQRRVVILARHILPNCVGPLAVAATLAIPEAIFIESFLAFIGIGVSAPQASWGTLASDGLSYISTAPEQLIWPAVAISVAMLAFNLFGDGLRDALDPSARR